MTYMTPNPQQDHRLFPIGLHCCHCDRWFRLQDAIGHLRQHMRLCGFCQADMQLVNDMLLDVRTALRSYGLHV